MGSLADILHIIHIALWASCCVVIEMTVLGAYGLIIVCAYILTHPVAYNGASQ